MEKLYVVHWASASCDDDGNAHAYCGIHGIYNTKSAALQGLVNCKDETYKEVLNDIDPDGEFPELIDETEIRVYGSEAEEHFEIDYVLGTEPCEIYITITEH